MFTFLLLFLYLTVETSFKFALERKQDTMKICYYVGGCISRRIQFLYRNRN